VPDQRYTPRPILSADPEEIGNWIEADALRSAARSKLAVWRLRRGLTQRQLAEDAGVALTSLRRMERREHPDPSLRDLNNCAIVLGVDVTDLLEDEWLQWDPRPGKPRAPARPQKLWKRAPGATPDEPRTSRPARAQDGPM
jgi:transcriptional regulator with XRE-family HTH domain